MKYVLRILPLIIFLSLIGGAGAEECEHVWTDFNPYVHGYAATDFQLEVEDEEFHQCIIRSPEKICVDCGARQYGESLSAVRNRHAFVVAEWRYQEEETVVMITWQCDLCGYLKTETALLDVILSGNADTCLLGGKCNAANRGNMYTDGHIYDSGVTLLRDGTKPNDDNRVVFPALLVDERGSDVMFTLVSRSYCSWCGRPSVNQLGDWSEHFEEDWSGLSIYTERKFLEMGMPSEMPYQLIDQLRAEAGAA